MLIASTKLESGTGACRRYVIVIVYQPNRNDLFRSPLHRSFRRDLQFLGLCENISPQAAPTSDGASLVNDRCNLGGMQWSKASFFVI